jgi:hypothetical protein
VEDGGGMSARLSSGEGEEWTRPVRGDEGLGVALL